MSAKPEVMRRKALKLQRQESLSTLTRAIKAEPLSHDQKIGLLNRIMKDVAVGKISAAEARKMTRALKV